METVAGQLEQLGHTIVAADPDYNLGMSWNFLSRSTSGLLDWVDRLGPNVTLDKRTLANTRTGWLLSQNTLRKARAREAKSQRAHRMDLQPRRRRAGADHRAAPAQGDPTSTTAADCRPTAR